MRKDKQKAIQLRKSGKSYNEISLKLDIPKSTLSNWFQSDKKSQRIKIQLTKQSHIVLAKNITQYNKKRSRLARLRWEDWQKSALKEIHKPTDYELKLIGTALYWAEGYKKSNWNIVFANSDPSLIRIMMNFFQKTCKVDKSKIKGQVQIHPNISEGKAIKYWMKVSGIPKSQFRKTMLQVTKSSKGVRKRNTLPYGTFRICINNVQLVNQIRGWMLGIDKAKYT